VLAFNIWVSEKADSEVVLQIHPDPESLENQLALLGDRVRATLEFADFESLEVHGHPATGSGGCSTPMRTSWP
jgi:hypothetical protein